MNDQYNIIMPKLTNSNFLDQMMFLYAILTIQLESSIPNKWYMSWWFN